MKLLNKTVELDKGEPVTILTLSAKHSTIAELIMVKVTYGEKAAHQILGSMLYSLLTEDQKT
jgi:hypothetical protein